MKNPFSRINPTTKGIILAFLATLGMANVYVFSKAALLEVNYFQFQFYWFGFALVWIVPFLFITGIIKKIPVLSRASNLTLLLIGLLETGAASHALSLHSAGRKSHHHFISFQPDPHFCYHPGDSFPW